MRAKKSIPFKAINTFVCSIYMHSVDFQEQKETQYKNQMIQLIENLKIINRSEILGQYVLAFSREIIPYYC